MIIKNREIKININGLNLQIQKRKIFPAVILKIHLIIYCQQETDLT